MRVLFLSLWYPHRSDEMLGLFVQKHADAVSIYADVRVLYVQADEYIYELEVEIKKHNNITEIIIYYPARNRSIVQRIAKVINYFRAFRIGFKILQKEGWRPDIIHANVLTRTPFIAWIVKKTQGIPYVITEHWTRLLKSQDNFKGFWRKKIARKVVKNAGCIMPVSIELKAGLEFNNLLLTRCEIVENVVDTLFYEQYPTQKSDKKQLLNITCFHEKHKNVFGLLRTVKQISNERDDFRLILVGTGDDFDITYDYYQSLNFKGDTVVFAGLKTSSEVARLMQNVDAIVQFSNYESAGVVVQEGLVSGRPVISTAVGIAPDYIKSDNGILVDIQDENQLYEAIVHVLDHPEAYDAKKISEAAKAEFSYERIGKKYFDIYQNVLNETK